MKSENDVFGILPLYGVFDWPKSISAGYFQLSYGPVKHL